MAIGSKALVGVTEPQSGALYFFTRLYAVAVNTFVECIRQPVYAVIVGFAGGMILISPYITLFTLTQGNKLVTDAGLATIMLAGLFLAAFSASSVITQEIDNKTVLTVISKPVGRTEFIFGKFFGVMLSLFVAVSLLALALVLTISGGSPTEDIEREPSFIIILSLIGCTLVSVLYGLYSNFFYDRPFTSRALGLLLPLYVLCFLVAACVDPRAVGGPAWGLGKGLNKEVIQVMFGCMLVMWSVLIMAALAVAISTRLSVVVNLTICSVFFVMGLLSDHFFQLNARESLGGGGAVTGLLELMAVLLGVAGLLLFLFKFVNRYLNSRGCLILLCAGVLIALLPFGFPWAVLSGLALLVLAGLLLTSLIVFFVESKRLAWWLKASAYAGTFLLGGFGALAIQWVLLRVGVDFSGANIVLAKAVYYFLPNLQPFWIANILSVGGGVSLYYVLLTGLYALFQIMAFLLLAVMLFRERQLA